MAEVTQDVEQAAQYVLENSRRSNASLNDEQRAADTDALMTAYRDIITKALASGHLDSPIAVRHRTEAVKPLVEALEKASRLIKLQADCLEGYAESSGYKAKPVPSVFHFQATHFRDIATDLDAALRSVQS